VGKKEHRKVPRGLGSNFPEEARKRERKGLHPFPLQSGKGETKKLPLQIVPEMCIGLKRRRAPDDRSSRRETPPKED